MSTVQLESETQSVRIFVYIFISARISRPNVDNCPRKSAVVNRTRLNRQAKIIWNRALCCNFLVNGRTMFTHRQRSGASYSNQSETSVAA